MFEIFKVVSHLINVKKYNTSNLSFSFQCRCSLVLFLALSLLGIQDQYFGDPILCKGDDESKLVNTLCWINSSFIVDDPYFNERQLSNYHVGIGPEDKTTTRDYQSYYQWVPHFLFIQALILYLPYHLWSLWERGYIKKNVAGLTESIQDDLEKKDKINRVVDFFMNHRHQFSAYSYKFFFCELLTLFNAVGQFCFTNKFLSGDFTKYGSDAMQYLTSEGNGVNPMRRIFPILSKCIINVVGRSGTVEIKDFLCVLPINILNEKIFLVCWFWLIILMCVSATSLILRAITLASYSVRKAMIQNKVSDVVPERVIDSALASLTMPEWFLLNQLGKNLDALSYVDMIQHLEMELKKLKTN